MIMVLHIYPLRILIITQTKLIIYIYFIPEELISVASHRGFEAS